jgi:hypothetical protein
LNFYDLHNKAKTASTTTMMPRQSIIMAPSTYDLKNGSREDAANNRRRQLGFMKYGVVDKKQRNATQSREHSRQLAMAFSQEQAPTPSASSISASFAVDFGNAFGESSSSSSSVEDDEEDFFSTRKKNDSIPSYSTTDRLHQLQQQQYRQQQYQQRNRMGKDNSTNSFFDYDPFANVPLANESKANELISTPPAPVIRSIQEERRRLRERNNNTTAMSTTTNATSLSRNGMVSNAASLDSQNNARTATPLSKKGIVSNTPSLDSMNNVNTMKRTNIIRHNVTGASQHRHPSPIHHINYFSTSEWSNAANTSTPSPQTATAPALSSSSFSSSTARPGFTTLPSNSSMQSDYATKTTSAPPPSSSRQKQQHIVMVSNLPTQTTDRVSASMDAQAATTNSVSSSASSIGSSSGAAARRRMRQQMKVQMSSQHKQPHNVVIAVADNHSLTPTSKSPQQGYNFRKKISNITNSESSIGSSRGGGKQTDHVANYQRSTTSSLINQNVNNASHLQQALNVSGYSASSATTNRSIGANWANTSVQSSVSLGQAQMNLICLILPMHMGLHLMHLV